jgi:RNA 3'-terminal phosphate cyclase (ATP)
MLTLDGSTGEGGGQILRSALALALVTGQPFAIERIRAGREKPGLKRQHLTAVLAAAEIGGASVEGAELGSLRLVFKPKRVQAGDYTFAVGTAGSATLVLQTLLPALLVADAPSTLHLSGGTHNPLAPPFEFLVASFGRALTAMGLDVAFHLLRHGFAPAGGGAFMVQVTPGKPRPLELLARTAAGLPRARALLAQLAPSIGERELTIVQKRLGWAADQCRVETVTAHGPGNMLLLHFPGTVVDEVIGIPGERSVTAERVAERACDFAAEFLAADVPVGEHLADQLLLPMALAGGGVFRTPAPSLHTRTNAEVIERFLPVKFDLRADGGSWVIGVNSR